MKLNITLLCGKQRQVGISAGVEQGRLVRCRSYLNLLCGIVLLFMAKPIYAQWSTDPSNNLIVTYGLLPEICSDSMGGAYITCENNTVYPRQIELRRLDRYGYQPWGSSRLIVGEYSEARYANIVADEDHGVLIAYLDREQYPPPYHSRYKQRLRVQRIDSAGNILWGANGVRVSLTEHNQSQGEDPSIVSDGEGGCVVAWLDTLGTVKAQRVNYLGQRVWSDSGIAIAKNSQYGPIVIQTSNITYVVSYGAHLKSFDSNGNLLWEGNDLDIGFGVISLQHDQDANVYVFGGFFIGYDGHDNVWTANVQKVSSAGILVWGSKGIFIDTIKGGSGLSYNNILSFDDGRTFLTWTKQMSINEMKGFVQEIRSNGSLVFSDSAKVVSAFNDSSYSARKMIKSNNYSVVFLNNDSREGGSLYAQRIDSSGAYLWSNTDVGISFRYLYYVDAISDNNGGITVVGFDQTDFSIRAQQCSREGRLGEIITGVHDVPDILPITDKLYQNYPNPFNPVTVIRYQLPTASDVKLAIYNLLGQEMRVLVNEKRTAGSYSIMVDGSQYPSGVYFYKLETTNFREIKKMVLMR